MDHETFISTVARRAGVPEATAERLVQATLRTLADRISGGEAEDIAMRLPDGLAHWLRLGEREEAQGFGVDEFVRRVADRGDVGPDEARSGAAAVLTTLRDAVPEREFEHVLSQLPKEYRELLGPMA
ncbi:MAG: DUF2267 domain-containing protein [Blastococcus sp.]|nr:hypothetical protein [Blastococcus sp.]